MQGQRRFSPLYAGVLAIGLLGCDSVVGTLGQDGFQADYRIARNALDSGQHQKAVRSYAPLVAMAGPAAVRVQLEYAHALLRAGEYDMASEQARLAAAQLDGMAKASALAVQASADQEIVTRSVAAGRADDTVRARYDAALAAMDVVLSDYPGMDPAGGLATRRTRLLEAGAALPPAL